MKRKLCIDYPIFEVGPKLYVYGERALEIARFADSLVERYDVQIIFSAQCMDISTIARETKKIHVFAQHVDAVRHGRGVGAILPEAIRDAGAEGTILNHAEKKLTLNTLYHTIQRCKEVGLMSLVCADSLPECIAAVNLGADIVLKECEDMIGRGESLASRNVSKDESEIRKHREDIVILHGAGIKDESDIYNIIYAGATATGATSAIFASEDPFLALERSIAAVRQAWDDRRKHLNIVKV